jgi:hypothetical protein
MPKGERAPVCSTNAHFSTAGVVTGSRATNGCKGIVGRESGSLVTVTGVNLGYGLSVLLFPVLQRKYSARQRSDGPGPYTCVDGRDDINTAMTVGI